MKKIMLTVLIIAGITSACTSSVANEKDTTASTAMAVTDTTEKDFSNVVFAIPIDTSCGMSLSDGIEDSLHFDGKVYGFCSSHCKAEFVAQLKKEGKL